MKKKQYSTPCTMEMQYCTADLLRAMDGSAAYMPTEPGSVKAAGPSLQAPASPADSVAIY